MPQNGPATLQSLSMRTPRMRSHQGRKAAGIKHSGQEDDTFNPMQRLSDKAQPQLRQLLLSNRAWAESVRAEDPGFFDRCAAGQSPKVLWIGCSDSRVEPTMACNLAPGELFVHRNIANVCGHSDTSLQAVLHYAVDVLKVEHIVVCGHHGCGGVAAALDPFMLPADTMAGTALEHWVRQIRDVFHLYRRGIDVAAEEVVARMAADGFGGSVGSERLKEEAKATRVNLLAELNAAQGAFHLSHSTIIQRAWARGQRLQVHGWIYRLKDGTLRDLGVSISGPAQIDQEYRTYELIKTDGPVTKPCDDHSSSSDEGYGPSPTGYTLPRVLPGPRGASVRTGK